LLARIRRVAVTAEGIAREKDRLPRAKREVPGFLDAVEANAR
jgi:hypothetical protein